MAEADPSQEPLSPPLSNEEEIRLLEEELGPDSAANPRHTLKGIRGLPTQVDDLVLFWNHSNWNENMVAEPDNEPVVPVRPPKGAQVLEWDFDEEKRAEPLPFWFNEFPSFLGTAMVIGGALFFTRGLVSVAWGYGKHVSSKAVRKTMFQMRHQRDQYLLRRELQREHGTVPPTPQRAVVPHSVLSVARARSQRYSDREQQLVQELRTTGRLLQTRFNRTPKADRMGLTLEQLITANSGKVVPGEDTRKNPKYRPMRRWPGLQLILRTLWQLRPVPRRGLRTLRKIHRMLMRRLKKGVKFSAVLAIFMLLLLAFFTAGIEHYWEYELDPVVTAQDQRLWHYLAQLRSDALGGREIGVDWGVVHLQRVMAELSDDYKAQLLARYGSLDQIQGPIARAKQRLREWYAPLESHVHAWRAEFLRDKYVWPIVVVLPFLLWFYNRSDRYHALFGFSFVTTGAYWMIDPNLKAYFNQPASLNSMRDVAEGGVRRSWGERTAEYASRLRDRLARETQLAEERRQARKDRK